MSVCVMFVRMLLEGGGYKYFKVGFAWNFNLKERKKRDKITLQLVFNTISLLL